MITLYQFEPQFGLPSASPPCMKLETFLRMCDIDYKVSTVTNLKSSPLTEVPYLDVGGRMISDPVRAIDFIEEQYCIDLDAPLLQKDKVIAETIVTLLEENIYRAMVYSRWIDPEFWPTMRKIWFSDFSIATRHLKAHLVRKGVIKTLLASGVDLSNQEEIYDMGCSDLETVSELLKDRKFIMGDQATKVDATVYAFIANILYTPIDTPLKKVALKKPNLDSYCKRMHGKYFPDKYRVFVG